MSPRLLSLLFALYGVALRTRQYASGRSLWLDELAVTLNIVRRSYGGLAQPLDHNQGAPLGWLVAEKTAVKVLGANEYALRLLPFVSGVLAVFVFWWVAHRLLPAHMVPVAVGLFAMSPFLVDYSSETKQYSSDVLAGLVLLALSLPLLSDKPRPRAVLTWGAAGTLAVWFSHPTVFLLAGFAAAVVGVHALHRRWRVVRLVTVGCVLWGLSFTVNYLVFLRGLGENDALLDFWEDGFVPWPLRPGSAIGWLGRTWIDLARNPVGLDWVAVVIATVLTAAGLVALARSRPRETALLAAPFGVFVAGALLHAYPMRGRLVLVLVPFVLLVACAAFPDRPRAVAVAAVASLLVVPAWASAGDLWRARTVTEVEPVLRSVAGHRQPGDAVWIHHGADLALRHYGPRFGIEPDAILSFQPSAAPCGDDPFRWVYTPRRVWVVFAHVYSNAPPDERETYLSRIGRVVESYEAPGAGAYLVDPAGPRAPLPRPATECLVVYLPAASSSRSPDGHTTVGGDSRSSSSMP